MLHAPSRDERTTDTRPENPMSISGINETCKPSWKDPGSVTPRLRTEAKRLVLIFFFLRSAVRVRERNFNPRGSFFFVSTVACKGKRRKARRPIQPPTSAATFIAPMKHRRGLLCNGRPNLLLRSMLFFPSILPSNEKLTRSLEFS